MIIICVDFDFIDTGICKIDLIYLGTWFMRTMTSRVFIFLTALLKFTLRLSCLLAFIMYILL